MKWKDFGRIGFAIAKELVPAIGAVEVAIKELKAGAKGPAKRAAVLKIVMGGLAAGELASEKDLLDDAKVQEAAGCVVDSIVSLNNVIEDARTRKEAAGHV